MLNAQAVRSQIIRTDNTQRGNTQALTVVIVVTQNQRELQRKGKVFVEE